MKFLALLLNCKLTSGKSSHFFLRFLCPICWIVRGFFFFWGGREGGQGLYWYQTEHSRTILSLIITVKFKARSDSAPFLACEMVRARLLQLNEIKTLSTPIVTTLSGEPPGPLVLDRVGLGWFLFVLGLSMCLHNAVRKIEMKAFYLYSLHPLFPFLAGSPIHQPPTLVKWSLRPQVNLICWKAEAVKKGGKNNNLALTTVGMEALCVKHF